jgi:hypothetical protein
MTLFSSPFAASTNVIILLLALSACAPKVAPVATPVFPPLKETEEVYVISRYDTIPSTAVYIKNIRVKDKDDNDNKGWDIAVANAKSEARKLGGNVVHITEVISYNQVTDPSFSIKAKILREENADNIKLLSNMTNPPLDTSWHCAKLYVYRKRGMGSLIGYDLRLDDKVIGRVKNNSLTEIILTERGPHVLSAKTEANDEAHIDIVWGKEYYLKCSIEMGVLIGRPELELMDNLLGKEEYNSLKNEK